MPMKVSSLKHYRIALGTIILKEILRFVRIWVQTILPAMVTMTLYFIIFGGLIGSRIGDMEGVRYMDFIVPGLILLAVITNSYANVVSSFYSSKFQRHIEEMLIAPLPASLIILGFVGGGLARGLAVGLGVTIISLFFSPLAIHHWAITLSVITLTSILFSLAGLINGIFASSFDDISIVPNFILTPLTYLGGVFYSVTLLPDFWQSVSILNPIFYMVNAFRYGMIGVSDISLTLSYAIIIGFIVMLYLVAWFLLYKGVGVRS